MQRRIVQLLLITFFLFAGSKPRVYAQASQLAEYLRQTLSLNQYVKIQHQQVELRRSQVRLAYSSFNWNSYGQVSRSRSLVAFSPLEKLQLKSPQDYYKINNLNYSLGVTKRFLTGQVLSAEASMSNLNFSYANETAYNGGVRFTLTQPLLLGASRSYNTAQYESSKMLLEAEMQQLQYVVSQQVRNTTIAYLNYVAYRKIVDTLAVAQRRYEQLLLDIEELVKAHKVKQADLIPIRANLADQVRSRLAAERELNTAKRNLALAVGYTGAQMDAMPAPLEDMPDYNPKTDTLPGMAYYTYFLEQSLKQRFDYLATLKALEATRVIHKGAEKGIKPRVDLSVYGGYSGFEYRSAQENQALRYLFAPLYNNVFGMNAGVTLNFQLSPQFDQAKGALFNAEALYEQAGFREQQLRNAIQTDIQTQYKNLALTIQELEKARESVEYYKTTTENEQIKLTLGSSTIINLLQSHTNLASATVNEINARLHYITTIVEFRFATGNLIRSEADAGEVDMNMLLRLPQAR